MHTDIFTLIPGSRMTTQFSWQASFWRPQSRKGCSVQAGPKCIGPYLHS